MNERAEKPKKTRASPAIKNLLVRRGDGFRFIRSDYTPTASNAANSRETAYSDRSSSRTRRRAEWFSRVAMIPYTFLRRRRHAARTTTSCVHTPELWHSNYPEEKRF